MQSKLQKILLLATFSTPCFTSPANTLLNDMQGCQALLSFVEQKLTDSTAYNQQEVDTVIGGLQAYNDYIQQTVVGPGLLQFSQNDPAKAAALQQQVDSYKSQLMQQLQAKYAARGIVMDNVIALNNCSVKSMPEGQVLEQLKQALMLLVGFSKAQ